MIEYEPHVTTLHQSAFPIDLHADTPVLLRWGYDFGLRHDPILPRSAGGFHLDLPRMLQGGLAAQFFGLPSWPWRRWPFRTNYGPAAQVDRLLDSLEKAAQRHSTLFTLVRTPAEIRAARAQGRIAGLRGIEGAHALEGDLDQVAYFARRGICYFGLLHFSVNEAGSPAYGWGRDGMQGLTPFGHALVEELNKQHIIVDLAHINRRGFMEAAAHSKAPVIVSHTGLNGVFAHWRNIDDDQIRAVARSGGCIGVIYSRRYLGEDSIQGVVNHVAHLINIGGEDLPALGSDYDGLVTPPEGLEDISRLPNLTAELLKQGFSERQIFKVLGDNVLRVLDSVIS